jgi:hypothetical protein
MIFYHFLIHNFHQKIPEEKLFTFTLRISLATFAVDAEVWHEDFLPFPMGRTRHISSETLSMQTLTTYSKCFDFDKEKGTKGSKVMRKTLAVESAQNPRLDQFSTIFLSMRHLFVDG